MKLKRGEYENINKAFIPLPAELAAMAHAECRLIREDRIRKQETLRAIEDSVSRRLPSSHGLMDLRVTQRERAIALAEEGFVRVAEGVDHLEFAHLAKSRELPAGSVHLWAIDEVWSPIAVRVNRSRIQTKLNVQPSPVSPERGDELARMLELPMPARSPPSRWRSRQGEGRHLSGRYGRRGASGMTIQHRTVDIEAASKLWKEDLSASQIAKRFGVSRNVIVGIAFRNRAFFPSKPRACNCRPHESKRAPRKDKTAMRDRKPGTIIIPSHKYDLERLPFAKRLLELRPGECSWPINDGSPFLFCAAKTAGKYCQHHQSRAIAVHRIMKREK